MSEALPFEMAVLAAEYKALGLSVIYWLPGKRHGWPIRAAWIAATCRGEFTAEQRAAPGIHLNVRSADWVVWEDGDPVSHLLGMPLGMARNLVEQVQLTPSLGDRYGDLRKDIAARRKNAWNASHALLREYVLWIVTAEGDGHAF